MAGQCVTFKTTYCVHCKNIGFRPTQDDVQSGNMVKLYNFYATENYNGSKCIYKTLPVAWTLLNVLHYSSTITMQALFKKTDLNA